MRTTQTLLFAITLLALSCTAQKKYELVLSVQDGAPTNDQVDSTITIIKKRLQPFDKGNTIITASPDRKIITIQTACGNQDFIHNSLIKKGKLEFFECITLQNVELVEAIKNTDKAMSKALQQGIPAVKGINNTVFDKDYPLLKLLFLQQPYANRNGPIQFPGAIASVMDSNIALLEKCLPLLYEQVPNCKAYFKKLDNPNKLQASEMYLLKTDASIFDASRHIASARADKDYTNHPVVTMEFDKTGTMLWSNMTTQNVGKYIAIAIDNTLLSVPMVNAPILGGSTQISGNFTWEEVQQLATTLKGGYLPLSLQIAGIQLANQKQTDLN